MKHTELEDGDQLVTRLELREVLISIREDILEIKSEVHELREMIRTRWWIPVLVAVVAMVANTVAILFHHP